MILTAKGRESQGFLMYPLLPSYSQGCALLPRRRCVLARLLCSRASTHLLSDPHVGREQSRHERQFRNTKA